MSGKPEERRELFDEACGIVKAAKLGRHRVYDRLIAPLFLHQRLSAFGIVPEPRLLGFRIEAFGLFFGVIYVKDTS